MAISSNGTGGGNWSAGASWAGGVAPTSADDVTIVSGDTITIDTTGCAAKSIANSGTLTCSQAASSDLTIATADLDNLSGSSFIIDLAAFAAINFTLKVASGTRTYFRNGATVVKVKGYPITRQVRLTNQITAGATSATITGSIAGWRIGDKVIFGATGGPGTLSDTVTLTAVNAGTGVITFSGGGITNTHKANAYVANLSSNVTFTSTTPGAATSGNGMWSHTTSSSSPAQSRQLSHVAFDGFTNQNYQAGCVFCVYGEYFPTAANEPWVGITDCAFREFGWAGIYYEGCRSYMTIARNCMASSLNTSGMVKAGGGGRLYNEITDHWHFQSQSTGDFEASDANSATVVRRAMVCGQAGFGGVFFGPWGRMRVYDGFFYGNSNFDYTYGNAIIFTNCDLGTAFNVNASNSAVSRHNADSISLFVDCLFHDTNLASTTELAPFGSVVIANKNGDPLVQETYTFLQSGPTYERDNAAYHGTDGHSLKINTSTTIFSLTQEFQVFAPNNAPLAVSGYVKRSAGQAVSITLSGLGIAPSTYNCVGANGTWEQFTVAGTNVSGTDGVLTLTVTVQSGTAGSVNLSSLSAPTPKAVNTGEFGYWFNGAPVATLAANFAAPIDVMNVLLSQLTLPASVGKAIAEMFRLHGLEAGTPLEVMPGQRKAGAAIVQTVVDSGGKVTVTRA